MGFQVWGPEGRLGVVAKVLAGSPPEDSRLVVTGGRFRRRSMLVPVDLVAEVDPERKRIVLASLPQPERGVVPDVVSAAKPTVTPNPEGGPPL